MDAIDPRHRPRLAAAAPATLLPCALLLAVPAALSGQAPADSSDPAALADTVAPVDPIPLPPLSVRASRGARSPKTRGFERRRRRHPAGVFVGREEIERRDPRRLSDLIRGVAGVTPVRPPGAGGRPRMRMNRTQTLPGRRPCRVRYFVDGLPLPKRSAWRIDDFAPEDVEGIEIYRGVSEVPPRFQRRDDRCGVVVIWTRAPGG